MLQYIVMDLPPESPSNSRTNRRTAPEYADQSGQERAANAGNQSGERLRISGRVRRIPRGGWLVLVRWLTGWALLCWLGRLLGAAIRLRRIAEIELAERTMFLRFRTEMLWRKINETEQVITLDSLQRVSRHARYPALSMAVGMASLSAGVALGAIWAFDGLASRDAALLIAAAVAFAGAALDLALDILSPGLAKRVAVEIETRQGFKAHLAGVPLQQANRFFEELSRRLEQKGGDE